MGLFILVGFFWGFNEGLWFFVIPDIALSLIALKGWKPALYSTIATVLGAMLSAILLYTVVSKSGVPELLLLKIEEIWSYFPGYYPKMFTRAASHLSSSGAKGLLIGPTSGIPYRFYVLEAIQQNISLKDLLFWTPLARLQRIAIAPIVVLAIQFVFFKSRPKFSEKWKSRLNDKRFKKILFVILCIYWIYIYVWYWGSFLPKTYS